MIKKRYVISTLASVLFCGHLLAAQSQQIALVPGADIVGTVAITALERAPLLEYINKAGRRKTPSRTIVARWTRINTATGLTKKDITSALFSCDIDTYDFKAPTLRGRCVRLNGIIAVQLAKPISIGKIQQAIKLEYGTEELAGVANITIAGHPALIVKSQNKKQPDIYIAVSPNQYALLIALTPASIAQSIQRAKSGQLIKEPKPLRDIRESLPRDSQIKIAAIVPPPIRGLVDQQTTTIQQQALQNPGLAATAAIIKIFRNLQNISIGIQITNDAILTIAGDLGDSQSAQQASVLISTLVIPMMQASMQNQSGSSAPVINIEKQVKIKSKDTNLIIQIRVPKEQFFAKKTQRPTR